MSARAIYKYVLSPYRTRLTLPAGSTILSCGAQASSIVVWAAVDPAATAMEEQPVTVIPTGEWVPDGWQFFGTVQMDDGLVFHVLTRGQKLNRPEGR